MIGFDEEVIFMLKRIYIDNFRCLVNFELNFDSINLFLGGNGSGKSTVFEALRKLQSLLIVLIDADKKTVAERLQQLNDTLTENSHPLRQPDEAIAVFVPKRNIETWIHYLHSENVDEETEYTKFKKQSECKPYVEQLVNQCYQGNLDDNSPPSLKAACGELQRILPLLDK
jgi:AAA15 family ATPase/GTPase